MVAEGFKQTEIGVIPQDWDVFTIRDLIELLTDFDANGSFSSVAENVRTYDQEEFAWFVRSTDLEKNSSLNNVKYIDRSSYRFLKKTALFGGELLILKRGDIGNVYFFEMRTEQASVAPNLYLLKLNNVSNSKYLFYYFKSNIGQLQLKSKNASSTLGALYKEDVKSIFVPLPPLPEQKAIAEALSDTDAWIENLEQCIAKKRLIKQGAMQDLLTSKEGWEVKKLGEVFNITAGGDLVKYNWSEIRTETFKYEVYSNALSNKGLYCFSSEYNCQKNTITVTARGTVGYAVARFKDYLAIGRLLSLTPIENLNIFYIAEVINNKLSFANESTGVPQLTAPQISNYKIELPPFPEQNRIATILSDMDNEIESLEHKLKKARQIKQGMMQELLTGRVRLV